MTVITHRRGAARVVIADCEVGERLESLDEIIDMDEGETQFDPRDWIIDLGSSRTGVKIGGDSIHVGICEVHPSQLTDHFEPFGEPFSLIVMMQNPDRSISAYIWYRVQVRELALDAPWRGEMSMANLDFSVLRRPDGSSGKILNWRGNA